MKKYRYTDHISPGWPILLISYIIVKCTVIYVLSTYPHTTIKSKHYTDQIKHRKGIVWESILIHSRQCASQAARWAIVKSYFVKRKKKRTNPQREEGKKNPLTPWELTESTLKVELSRLCRLIKESDRSCQRARARSWFSFVLSCWWILLPLFIRDCLFGIFYILKYL